MSVESKKRYLAREARVLDNTPDKPRGDPDDFIRDRQKQARILADMRAFKAQTIDERAAGVWCARKPIPFTRLLMLGKEGDA